MHSCSCLSWSGMTMWKQCLILYLLCMFPLYTGFWMTHSPSFITKNAIFNDPSSPFSFQLSSSSTSSTKPIAKSSFQYTGRIRSGKLSRTREVPAHIIRPEYAKLRKTIVPSQGASLYGNVNIEVKSSEQIERMRVVGRLAREVLDEAVRAVKPGMTTDDIDKIVHQATIDRNAYPSPLRYEGFPKSCCTSVNEIICHGIPDTKLVLQDGDIMNIDVTVYYNGMHGDCSETVFVGTPSNAIKDLVITTYESLQKAIEYCKPGMPYNGVGGVIEDYIKTKGYSSVQGFGGHGIGSLFHTDPIVVHYKNNYPLGIMAPGHTFTIEPMICLGSNTPVNWPDDWTIATSDGLASAQFEHTLLITDTGVDILTKKLPSSPLYSWE